MSKTISIYEEIELTKELLEQGADFRFKAPKPGIYYSVFKMHNNSTLSQRLNVCSSAGYHADVISISEQHGFTVCYNLMGSKISKVFHYSEFEVDTKIKHVNKQ